MIIKGVLINKLALSLLAATFLSADNLCKQFETDQDWQNVCPDFDPNHLHFDSTHEIIKKKANVEKSQQTTRKAWKITQHASSKV